MAGTRALRYHHLFTRGSHAPEDRSCKYRMPLANCGTASWVRFPSPAPVPANAGQQQPRRSVLEGGQRCSPVLAWVGCRFTRKRNSRRRLRAVRWTPRTWRKNRLTAKSSPRHPSNYCRIADVRITVLRIRTQPLTRTSGDVSLRPEAADGLIGMTIQSRPSQSDFDGDVSDDLPQRSGGAYSGVLVTQRTAASPTGTASRMRRGGFLPQRLQRRLE